MRLDRIIQDAGTVRVDGDVLAEIGSVCNDSRKACPGALFIAVKGCGTDGHSYIGKAVEAGAVAVVYEDDGPFLSSFPGVTFVKVASSRHAVAMIAAAFYGNPSSKLTLVGITGTNGKTTTVTLLY